MKPLNNILLFLLFTACYDHIKSQCATSIWAFPNGAAVQFSSAFDSSASFSSYYWDFGDGDTSQSLFPLHVYAQSGTYSYCLHYTSFFCTTDTCNSVTVDICDFNPQFNFSSTGLAATFSPLHPQSGSLYKWYFYSNAGTLLDTAINQNPLFTFPNYGSFMVALQVTLQNGCTDSL